MSVAASPNGTSASWSVEPVLIFRRGREPQPRKDDPESEKGQATLDGSGRALRCAACGHRITTEGDRISVGASHEHRFFNPAGFLFQIGCFRNAPGCFNIGQPTTEFTWFPGFAWRHSLCEGCGQHLGWHFENGDGNTFFGLVLNRLIESEDSRQ